MCSASRDPLRGRALVRSTEPRTRVSAVAGFDPYRGRTTFAPPHCTHAACPITSFSQSVVRPLRKETHHLGLAQHRRSPPASNRQSRANVGARPGHAGSPLGDGRLGDEPQFRRVAVPEASLGRDPSQRSAANPYQRRTSSGLATNPHTFSPRFQPATSSALCPARRSTTGRLWNPTSTSLPTDGVRRRMPVAFGEQLAIRQRGLRPEIPRTEREGTERCQALRYRPPTLQRIKQLP